MAHLLPPEAHGGGWAGFARGRVGMRHDRIPLFYFTAAFRLSLQTAFNIRRKFPPRILRMSSSL